MRSAWTDQEDAVVLEHYPLGGAAPCLSRLPGRTMCAIYQRADCLGVRYEVRQPRRKTPPTSEWIDAQITRIYSVKQPARGELRDLAKRLDRTRYWVSARARALGLMRARKREPAWSAEEDELIEIHGWKTAKNIRLALLNRGFTRSETAIAVRRKRLGMRADDPDHYSARGLGDLMGVDSKKVTRWIASGQLKAKRRGTDRVAEQGGDEWTIARKDAREFLIRCPGEWDHRKTDQLWLIETLAGRVGLSVSEAVA